MKIPSLLAQYLYCHHRLDLPGIGSFVLDNSSIAALENSKQRTVILDGVKFEHNPSLQGSPDLIAFIAQKTGKMKPLAASDLDSHLQLANQFLNIGKPFTFEGIGILTRIKPGEFELTPISVQIEKLKEHQVKEVEPAAAKETSSQKYESFLSPTTKLEWKRPVAALLVICGIGLTIWGGYEISKRMKKSKPVAKVESVKQETQAAIDSSQAQVVKDSVIVQPPAPTEIKYVLEIAKSKRAFKRYNQLKEINWKVHLETTDSVQYKLYMLLPVSDTTKTLDSLTVMTGRRVYIEYPDSNEQRKVNL